MIIVGEKLNSSIPRTREAIARRDESDIVALAKAQLDGGAKWLDVNASVFMEGEREALLWMMDAVQRATGAKVMIDCQNAAVVAAALAADRVDCAIINSVMLDEERIAALLPLIRQYDAGIVALPITMAGMPKSPAGRLENARSLVDKLTGAGIAPEKIYIDPLVEALASNSAAAAICLETIRLYRKSMPAVNILCGVSNVSFGLPGRSQLNAAFLTGAILAGANAAIADAADPAIRQAVFVAEALSGRDEYCGNYLRFFMEAASPAIY